MSDQIKVAYLDYRIDDLNLDLPAVEQHRQRALAAINHISGLGKLMQCIDFEQLSAPESILKRRLANLIDGSNTVGDLLVILADSAYMSVSEMNGFISVQRSESVLTGPGQ